MRQKLEELRQTIDRAKRATFMNKIPHAEAAVSQAHALLVDMAERVDALEKRLAVVAPSWVNNGQLYEAVPRADGGYDLRPKNG